MILKHNLPETVRHFELRGDFLSAEPCGSGHINDTYCVTMAEGNRRARYILQRINHKIFTNPIALMENIQRVTTHIGGKIAGQADPHRRVITLIHARDGKAFHFDAEGQYWRAFQFIENARTFDTVESPAQAFEAARAF